MEFSGIHAFKRPLTPCTPRTCFWGSFRENRAIVTSFLGCCIWGFWGGNLVAFSSFWEKQKQIKLHRKIQICTIRTGKQFISIFGVYRIGGSVFESFEKYLCVNVQKYRIVLLLIFEMNSMIFAWQFFSKPITQKSMFFILASKSSFEAKNVCSNT